VGLVGVVVAERDRVGLRVEAVDARAVVAESGSELNGEVLPVKYGPTVTVAHRSHRIFPDP
jgi:hypothetical protein